MPVEIPPPICACCMERIHTAWRVTNPPKVYVICGKPECAGWASSQGLTFYSSGVVPVRKAPRTRPTARIRPQRARQLCDHCRQPLPAKRDRFHGEDGRVYCTLTCMQAAGSHRT